MFLQVHIPLKIIYKHNACILLLHSCLLCCYLFVILTKKTFIEICEKLSSSNNMLFVYPVTFRVYSYYFCITKKFLFRRRRLIINPNGMLLFGLIELSVKSEESLHKLRLNSGVLVYKAFYITSLHKNVSRRSIHRAVVSATPPANRAGGSLRAGNAASTYT